LPHRYARGGPGRIAR
jgi:hypothetical protein